MEGLATLSDSFCFLGLQLVIPKYAVHKKVLSK